ncbi:MAG: peptide/nickel transport system substrate-binding protein [Gaiellaceae bacterium]|nr:peptide/nickel transport system substrate-binding protein [Gaiellaceae bacterium]
MRARTLGLLAIAAFGVAVWFVAAAAGSGHAVQGGTLRVNISKSDVTTLDPQIDYEFLGGSILWATCVKLVYYPDQPAPLGSQLRPEAAAGLPRVSANGRTYTFTVRKGYRFNTGEAVTAASFGRSFERIYAPKMGSPGVNFVSDIVGAPAALKGKVKLPTGIRIKGNTLSITLTQPSPDLIARLGMNFFCAVPTNTPIDPNGVTPAMAGPYYVAQRVPNRRIVLKPNPFYHGPRPHHLGEIDFTPNTDTQTSFLQIEKDQADFDLYQTPPTQMAGLAKKFGVNRGRFWVHPALTVNYVAMNTQRAPFNNAKLRQAVNFAISRSAILAQGGFKAGNPTDQVLPPAMHGFRDAKIYPLTAPDIARAKSLTGGKNFTVTLYTTTDDTSTRQAEVVQNELAKIGITVNIKQYAFGVLVSKTGVTSEPYDMVALGWIADYADPFDFINILLSGDKITKTNNVNLAQFNDPKFNSEINHAALLTGPKRFSTYGKLDVDMSRIAAPWASLSNSNTREFVSSHVGCYTFQPIIGAMDLASACLKK